MSAYERLSAKRAFILADRLKVGPFDSPGSLLAAVEAAAVEIDGLPEAEVDRIISTDPERLERCNRARWRYAPVGLSQCRVYSRMGERAWAVGTVGLVARRFSSEATDADRIHRMIAFAKVYAERLPLILFRDGEGLRINDGNHRAIAMFLAGIRTAPAWVGE